MQSFIGLKNPLISFCTKLSFHLKQILLTEHNASEFDFVTYQNMTGNWLGTYTVKGSDED